MRYTAQLLAGVVLLAGCSGEPIPTENATRTPPQPAENQDYGGSEGHGGHDHGGYDDHDGHNGHISGSVRKQLDVVRRVTARFHKFEMATAAGWSAKITDCMIDPAGAGGMGFHYGNTRLIDGSVRVSEPELLLYEPDKNGRLRLLAVEYIIPYAFVPRDAAPPVLFGQKFQQNDMFQLWGLHAWIWKENPKGIFAPWNPRVTCKYAPPVPPDPGQDN